MITQKVLRRFPLLRKILNFFLGLDASNKLNNQISLPRKHVDLPKKIKVVGVTFNNEDGASRQTVIQRCHPNDPITLSRTPSKKYPNAIAVITEHGQIGHVPSELAVIISPLIDQGLTLRVRIKSIVGGASDKPTFGCYIEIIDSNWNHTLVTEPYREFGLYFFASPYSTGKEIASLRKQVGLSQLQLAQKLGYKSASFVARLEKGEVDSIEFDQAEEISRILGVSRKQIFP